MTQQQCRVCGSSIGCTYLVYKKIGKCRNVVLIWFLTCVPAISVFHVFHGNILHTVLITPAHKLHPPTVVDLDNWKEVPLVADNFTTPQRSGMCDSYMTHYNNMTATWKEKYTSTKSLEPTWISHWPIVLALTWSCSHSPGVPSYFTYGIATFLMGHI